MRVFFIFLVPPRGPPFTPLPQPTPKIKKYIAIPFICHPGDLSAVENDRVIHVWSRGKKRDGRTNERTNGLTNDEKFNIDNGPKHYLALQSALSMRNINNDLQNCSALQGREQICKVLMSLSKKCPLVSEKIISKYNLMQYMHIKQLSYVMARYRQVSDTACN